MSLIGLLSSLKNGLSQGPDKDAHTVSTTFALHRLTAYALLAASLFSTATQFLGGPIHCFGSTDIPGGILDTYCWYKGTATVVSDDTALMSHPGVRKAGPKDEILKHTYYQWVCFVLFFQALFFYVPYKLWKHAENGRIGQMVRLSRDQDQSQPNALGEYLFTHYGTFTWLVLKYFLCECLAFANVFLQIYLMDLFLGGFFLNYGSLVLGYDPNEDGMHPIDKFFPRVTKCSFTSHGAAGMRENNELLCVLPLNVINEKIFLILWFWLLFLFVFTLLHFILEIMLFLSSVPRLMVLRGFSPRTPKTLLRTVIRLADYGDWFVLVQLAKNLEQSRFKSTLEYLARHMRYALDDDDDDPRMDFVPSNDPSRKTSHLEMTRVGKVAMV